MRFEQVNPAAVAAAVGQMPLVFQSRDVSDAPVAIHAHGALAGNRDYHAHIASYLSLYRSQLGIESIGNQPPRGEVWRRGGLAYAPAWQQAPAAAQAQPPAYASAPPWRPAPAPQAGFRRNAISDGRWYVWLPIVTAGMLGPVGIWHAALRLRRRDVTIRASVYTALVVLMSIIVGITPEDAAGNPVGAFGTAMSILTVLVAMPLTAATAFDGARLRKGVWHGATLAPEQPARDPAVAAAMAARRRRDEARKLAERDIRLARELHIGRPDLPRQYDDGGLVDINTAPPPVLSQILGVAPTVADRIAAVREKIDGFTSIDDAVVYTEATGAVEDALRERGIVLPR